MERGRSDRWCSSAFPFLFPGFPFLGGHELEESITSIRKEISSDGCGRRCGSATSRDFDGVGPEALRELTAGATGRRRMGRLQVDGAVFEIDGVEPEVSDGSQAPMNGLGKEKGPMRGLQATYNC